MAEAWPETPNTFRWMQLFSRMLFTWMYRYRNPKWLLVIHS